MKRSFLIKPVHRAEYPKAVYGQGVYLYDDQGKQYLDGSSGAVTASIGHAVEEVVEAMYKQAQKVSFVYRSQMTSEPAEKLAEKLNELAFGNEENYSSFFVNSGSEATETAMKIAIQHWQEKGEYRRNRVISRWTSYHGITMGALSLSGHAERRKRFHSLLDENPAVSAPNCYRCPFNEMYPGCQMSCATELHTAIQRYGAESIAAFIAEPIVGASGGVIVPPEGYYQRIKEICDFHNILFIADEVMTGIGRTGKMFAMEHWGVKPDIITLGKGMSAGYTPMAATLVSDKVMEPIIQGSGSIMSGHTYSANPQSAAVSLAVLNYIEKHGLVEKGAENGVYLLDQLRNRQRNFPFIGEIRGKGLMVGIEFVSDVFTKFPFSKELSLTNMIVNKARDKGLLIYPSSAGIEGGDGDAVIISPPLTIQRHEIDKLIDIFFETMTEIQNEVNLNRYKAL
ncbi:MULTISPECIES: aspartate aminotransferase family protein [Cytobacillus]|uniref:aspartate aminotransferase family protein n=1 Tax=Cytobacillus TaxID=2675230 RepID=UPI00203D4A85|nr:aspartate aminotransferase family protein [Cytobacillus firmus]MCM3706365.1 aspartate aminotransferase family protein [Cytobacillus firmus]URM32696.1 aspartate aminotransferase family protein [Cytobacillus firmus]